MAFGPRVPRVALGFGGQLSMSCSLATVDKSQNEECLHHFDFDIQASTYATMIECSVNIDLNIFPESQISALKLGHVRFLPRSMTEGFLENILRTVKFCAKLRYAW